MAKRKAEDVGDQARPRRSNRVSTAPTVEAAEQEGGAKIKSAPTRNKGKKDQNQDEKDSGTSKGIGKQSTALVCFLLINNRLISITCARFHQITRTKLPTHTNF
jgi:NADH dehydrogenase FAD-containing subunit